MHNSIIMKGAREHNLKNIDVLAYTRPAYRDPRVEGMGKTLTLRTKSGRLPPESVVCFASSGEGV